MRVAIIAEVYLPKIDGVVIRTMNLIRELQAAGDDVEVFCPEAVGAEHSPVPLTTFPGFPFPLYPEYRVGRPTRELVERLNAFQPDVVHFLNPFAFGFQCYDMLCRSGWTSPTVFSFHTLYAEYVRRYRGLMPLASVLSWMTRVYHNRADLNLTVSSLTRDSLRESGFERVELWQPAVNSELYSPEQRNQEMRSRLGGAHGKQYQLLTVSRLAPEKNVEFLADVLRNVPDASLAIVGDGPHRAALERRFAGLPVTFPGYLQGQDLAQAYASSDAFVYASETETMGNVVLEAMSSGLSVVAPRAGGIPSLVTHEQTGLLFSAGDVASATQLTHSVLQQEELRTKLGAAARAFACRHSWQQSAARVRADYQKVIDGSQHAASSFAPVPLAARVSTRCLVSLFRLASRLTRNRQGHGPAGRDLSVENELIASRQYSADRPATQTESPASRSLEVHAGV